MPDNEDDYRLEIHNLIDQFETLWGIREPQPTLMEQLKLGSSDDNSSFEAILRLSVDERTIEIFAAELGLEPPTPDPVIKELARTIGEDTWVELAQSLARLREDFKTMQEHGTPKQIIDDIPKAKKLCEELADLLERRQFDRYAPLVNSPFAGMVAKHVYRDHWIFAIRGLLHERDAKFAFENAKRFFFGLHLLPPTPLLVKVLREFGSALSPLAVEEELFKKWQFTTGKFSEKEFAKRVVFDEIRKLWPKRNNPNKQTAAVVNRLLDLSEPDAVKPNDITQMNKKNRRRYIKE